jgi:hypothetical protein
MADGASVSGAMRSSRGAIAVFTHVLKRLALVLAAYLIAVVAGLAVLLAAYLLLSSFPGAPDYFTALAISPIVMVAAPPLGLLVLWLSYILTAPQVVVMALISEFFRLRSVFAHALFGMIAAVSGFVFASPTLTESVSATDWADIGIVAFSGLAAGMVYWAIAGRKAGFKP